MVKDSSKDPQGGATGGGKQSGLGGEGLRGRTPDHSAEPDERLPGQQAELRQKAEALMRTLTVHNLPTADLEDAIAKMGMLAQASGQRAPGVRFADVRNDVLASLRDAQTALQAGVRAGAERSQAGKEEVRATLPETSESVPFGYERSVQAYFRGLAAERN